MQTRVKNKQELVDIRASGKILATVLQATIEKVESGMSTARISDIALVELKKHKYAKPVFLGYQGFPSIMCISVNDEVIHGIPKKDKIVADGDIVSLDFGVNYNGMITDAAKTFVVGKTNSANKLLIKKTKEALDAGISVVKNGTKVGSIGYQIESVLKKANLGVVKDYVGHGVGHDLHEEPNIPNYGKIGTGFELKENMTIAIEPMATIGAESVYTKFDGWTVATVDGNNSAHFEDTVLVKKNGFEILTR